MLPDARVFGDCSAAYLRSLIDSAGLSQVECAKRLGISPRGMRLYLAGNRPIPYSIQLGMELIEKETKK